MSDMKKCTHCNKIFATDEMTESFSSPTKIYWADYGEKRKYAEKHDLCANCSEELFAWLWRKHIEKDGSDG